MKIRNDFVSNSSSCSFIIEDVEKTAKLFSDVFNTVEIPYEYSDKIEIYIEAKNRWFKEIEEKLTGSSNYSNTWSDYRDGSVHLKDPEDIGWDRIRINLETLSNANTQLDMYKKSKSITFECDDYDIGAMNALRQLYDFFKRNNCNPNASSSEKDFLIGSNSSFTQLLASYQQSSQK